MLDSILELSLAKELIVVLISALPIFELRASIPVAIVNFDFPWYYAFLLAVIGNMLPVPIILLFLESVAKLLSRISVMKLFFDWLFERAKNRSQLIQKYKHLGLIVLVAIPLPITGAWTGSLVAVFLGIGFKQAFCSIFTGVIIAGMIVTCLTLLGWVGAIIAGVALLGIVIYGFVKNGNKKQNSRT
ncbi:MAG: small multi-drug export protein [Dehalococcoidales bacterium]|nr:small multi-drug export protein [Dehalococcoidales bacterium]